MRAKLKIIILLAFSFSVLSGVFLLSQRKSFFLENYYSLINKKLKEGPLVEYNDYEYIYTTKKTPTSIDAVDENNATLLLVTTRDSSTVELFNSSNKEAFIYNLPPGSAPRVSTFCDLENDGFNDLLVPLWGEDNSQIAIFNRKSSELKPDQVSMYSVGYRPRKVICADLNADGFNDILTADNFSNTISILRNNGQKIQFEQSIGVDLEPGSVSTFDINNDGLPDLIVSHRKSNTLVVFENKGGFIFSKAITLPTLRSPKAEVMYKDSDNMNVLISADGDSQAISIFNLDGLKVNSIDRVFSPGFPHSIIKIKNRIPIVVTASYPNIINVFTNCGKKFILFKSLWIGGMGKEKLLYVVADPVNVKNIFAVSAAKNSILKIRLPQMSCNTKD